MLLRMQAAEERWPRECASYTPTGRGYCYIKLLAQRPAALPGLLNRDDKGEGGLSFLLRLRRMSIAEPLPTTLRNRDDENFADKVVAGRPLRRPLASACRHLIASLSPIAIRGTRRRAAPTI